MSGLAGRSGRPRGSSPADRRVRTVLAAVCCLGGVLLVLAGPVAAQDASPPSFGNTTVVNETAFELVIEGDANLVEDSIDERDFTLSTGAIDRIGVAERGNDSLVTVHLTGPITSDDTTISLRNNASVADAAGNELVDDSAAVVGMDGVAPILQRYDVRWADEPTATIGVTVNEPLDRLSVEVLGRDHEELGLEDFEEIERPGQNEYRYETTHTFDAEDEYRIRLLSVADVWGNRKEYRTDRSILYDDTSPEPRVDGPTTVTVGEEVVFDGATSSDEFGVDTYEWLVDGNESGSGETFVHAFEDAGSHEVALRATDRRNNTATTRYHVDVRDPATTAGVDVAERNGTGVGVAVGSNRSEHHVLIERNGGLASDGPVVLDSLTLSVPANETANLSTAADADVPATFDVDDGTPFGTLSVDHDGADVANVTVRFSVARSALADANVSLDTVSLFVERDGWTRLPTDRIDGTDSHASYRASTPGLARFAVAGTEGTVGGGDADAQGDDARTEGEGGTGDEEPNTGREDGTANISVVDGEVLTRNVSAGERVVARAIVENAGDATGTYVAGLTVDGSLLDTTNVTVPPGDRREVTIAAPAVTGGSVAINGTTLGTVTVGNGPAPTEAAEASGGGLPIPNPLALWPGGLFGRVLGAIVWLVLIVYGILKGLAIYLGY